MHLRVSQLFVNVQQKLARIFDLRKFSRQLTSLRIGLTIFEMQLKKGVGPDSWSWKKSNETNISADRFDQFLKFQEKETMNGRMNPRFSHFFVNV